MSKLIAIISLLLLSLTAFSQEKKDYEDSVINIEYVVKDGLLEVTKKIEKQTVVSYDYDYLIQQRQAIIIQKEKDNEKRDKEIEFIDLLISEAKKAGLDVKPN